MPQASLSDIVGAAGNAPAPKRASLADIVAVAPTPERSLATRAKDVATGFGKGAAQEITGLSDLLAPLVNKMAVMTFGRGAALPPEAQSASDQLGLAATNTDQMIGKGAEFVTSLLGPYAVGKLGKMAEANKAAAARRVIPTTAAQMPPLVEAAGPRVMPNLVPVAETPRTMAPLAEAASNAPREMSRLTPVPGSVVKGAKAPTLVDAIQEVLDAARADGPVAKTVTGAPPQTITDAGYTVNKAGERIFTSGNPATRAEDVVESAGRVATDAGPAPQLTKSAKIADTSEGSRKLSELWDAIHGADAPTKGNGAIKTIETAVEPALKAGKVEQAAQTIEQKIKLTVSELAEKMRAEYGSQRAGKMLQPNMPAKVGAAQVKRLAPGESKLPAFAVRDMAARGTSAEDVAAAAAKVGKRAKSAKGEINPKVAMSLAGGAAGAVAGGTQGDTTEERIENAVMGGTAGAVAVPLLAHAFAGGVAKPLQKGLYTAVLSSPQSVTKAYLGGVGGAISAAMEKMAAGEIEAGQRILNQLFSRDHVSSMVKAVRSGGTMGQVSGRAEEAPTLLARLFDGVNEPAIRAMEAGGISKEEAIRYTLSGIPTTPMGRDVLGLWSRYFPLRLATTLFPRVGVQVLERGIERTPLGLAKLNGLNEGVSTAGKVARAAAGTAAGGTAYALNDQTPDWAKPYLVALSGVYGLPVGLGIAGAEAGKRAKGVMGQLRAGTAEFASNLPFPQFGPAQALDPENLAQMAVPNLLRDVARARDPYERQTAGITLGRARAKIPGLREQLPVKGRNVNIAGEPNDPDTGAAHRFFTPTAKEPLPQKGIPPAVTRELSRLDIGLNTPAFERKLTIGKREIAVPADIAERARAERRQFLIPQVQKLIDGPAYQRADDVRKKRMLEAIIARAEAAGSQRARASLIKTLRERGAFRAGNTDNRR